MATFYTAQTVAQIQSPPTFMPGDVTAGQVKSLTAVIDLAAAYSNATTTGVIPGATDNVVLGNLPRGAVFLYGVITSSVTLGSSTVAVGITGATTKYKSAAVFTAVDTPTLFGPAAATAAAGTSAVEQILLTVGAAALPTTGIVTLKLVYAQYT